MSRKETPPPYPRDKDRILRDFELAGRLGEIRDWITLRDRLAPKWWEALVGVLQFAAALGLLAALVQHPALREDALLRMIVFWTALLVLALVLGFEFMILKLYHLRRALDLAIKTLQKQQGRLDELENGDREGTPQAATEEK